MPDSPALLPNLTYADTGAAVDWLQRAFGFEPGLIKHNDAGVIDHAEMHLGSVMVVLKQPFEDMATQSPRDLGGANTSYLYIYVENADDHCARAEAAGAWILEPPTDQPWGDRAYRVVDIEGHRWRFAHRLA